MKIPYGESNFKTVISGGYVYVDKTATITQLEEAGKYLFLLRPRRFGKSLFLSMLEYYYDMAYRDEFDTLFGRLAIGQNPTPLRNSYQVLFMDFSGIDTDAGHDAILQRINDKLDTYLLSFLLRYGHATEIQTKVTEKNSPAAKMEYFMDAMSGQKLLLLIDEYDHFANSILAADMKLFLRVMGKGGFVRSFYETLKTATQRGTLDRLFVTGVTPIMLDSMTSGFNIGQNLSLHEGFNEAIGFTKTEVSSLLQPLADACASDTEQLLADVTRWYNGYRFNIKALETVYNANMVLYFVKNFDLRRCTYPKPMMDENIASDYGKIMGMFSIGNRDENFAVLDELINQGAVQASQRRKFEFDKGFDRDDFISLLAYMGFVTLQNETLAGETFVIPNYAIREFYFHYFKVELERRNQISIPNQALRLAVEKLALYADIQPLMDEMVRALQLLSNRDAMGMDEKHVKVLLLTLLYQTQIYFVQSERELNRRYPDILLLERNPIAVPHQHLIELKYSKKSDKAAGWAAKKQEGMEQVQGYLQLPEIAALQNLVAWLLVTDGERVEVVTFA
ncbi:AAA family ATPase [Thiothrix subterranea]|uniref:AAA family ATPase n=1 Tax=Thiothrix subterranea TaxID=2735563 RepID=A0AA51MTP9_9GAMM|nr:AAA family ATPase [Thiothrix subterranea]MDQ5766968.1 AAA family ATPase [Thiothrix subterranea]WML88171.1 AAA family ATPase [Thiothrix subterranea]